MTINLLIKAIREALGLSQMEFGELLNIAQAHVSRIEKGESKPPADVCRILYQESGIRDLLVWLCGDKPAETLERIIPVHNRIKFA